MVARGHVENGVIVLDGDVHLAEGQEVAVVVIEHKPEPRYEVTPERREALLSLIGIWKTDNPPNDEEVEKIIEEYRMQKYG